MEIERHLREEIDTQISYLGGVDANTDEYKMRVDSVTKLLDRAIEMEKLAREHDDRVAAQQAENDFKVKQAQAENDLKVKQMEEDRKDRKVKNIISVIGIALPLGVTVWGTLASFKFEETGTVTTPMGRGFLNKLLPKK